MSTDKTLKFFKSDTKDPYFFPFFEYWPLCFILRVIEVRLNFPRPWTRMVKMIKRKLREKYVSFIFPRTPAKVSTVGTRRWWWPPLTWWACRGSAVAMGGRRSATLRLGGAWTAPRTQPDHLATSVQPASTETQWQEFLACHVNVLQVWSLNQFFKLIFPQCFYLLGLS